MDTATSVDRVLSESTFRELVSGIVSRWRTFAPVLRDGSVVVDEIRDVDDLARSVTLEHAPGSCRVVPLAAGDTRRFAWAVGPMSAKDVLHPSARRLFAADLDGDGFTVLDAPEVDTRPVALVGLRPCDVAAMGVLDHVLHAPSAAGPVDAGEAPLVVAVNCTEPGGTCFCVSMGTGPAIGPDDTGVHRGVDITLWERPSGDQPEYLVGRTSERGARLLDDLDTSPTGPVHNEWVAEAHRRAEDRMGRRLLTDNLPEKLLATLGSARWEEVAGRCLSCGNCTLVCPTCFCSTVDDITSLEGDHVERWQRWDTCFSLDHSYVHGGSVRPTIADRYRQWLTHKLSTWWAQFGESGCVGCGRCIAWCPVGIDIVEEANALAAEADTVLATDGPPATAVFLVGHTGGRQP